MWAGWFLDTVGGSPRAGRVRSGPAGGPPASENPAGRTHPTPAPSHPGAYALAGDRGYLAWPDVDGGFAIALLLLSLVLLLAVVLLAIFTAALSVRRLHDCNLSGLWFLLILVPFLGSIALLIMAALPPAPRGVRFAAHPAPGTVMPAGR